MRNKLYFYHGAMNCGKSASIIMQVYNLRMQNFKVMVMKPRMDNRNYGVVYSRAIQNGIEAFLIDEDTDILESVKNESPDIVFIDEVNFLSSSQIDEISNIVDELNIPVYGYGLMVDYKSELFDGSKRMIELSNSVRELSSICVRCGLKAKMHLRKSNGEYVFEGNPIHVGDIDEYESVCRKCYKDCKNP